MSISAGAKNSKQLSLVQYGVTAESVSLIFVCNRPITYFVVSECSQRDHVMLFHLVLSRVFCLSPLQVPVLNYFLIVE
jgi:hypothetical protein